MTDPLIPDCDVTLAASVDQEFNVDDATIFEVAQDDDNFWVSKVGAGESIPEALRDFADRLEEGQTDLATDGVPWAPNEDS